MTQIDHPDYYSKGGIEAIDYIDAHSLSFSLGNVIKYITRAGHKEDEDASIALHKALWYLAHEISLKERQKKKRRMNMTNALQVFSYKAKEVRTTIIDGEVWFVAKDVCDILELENVSKAVSALDDDEKMTLTNSEGHSGQRGGAQSYNVINEAGLYALVLRSNKPEAKAFSRWVRHEVLPSIRKTGSYTMFKDNPAIPSGVMDSAKLIFETAGIKDNQLALALDKVHKSYTGRSALEAGGITLTAPTQNQILTPTEIGSHFGIKAHRVNEILAGAGYQHKINGKWEVLQPGQPYAIMQDTGKRHTDGTPVRQLKWDSSILSVFPQLFCA